MQKMLVFLLFFAEKTRITPCFWYKILAKLPQTHEISPPRDPKASKGMGEAGGINLGEFGALFTT